MLRNLRIKIICFTMTIVGIMLLIMFGTVYYFTSRNLEAESLRMMQTMAVNPFQLDRPNEMPDEVRLPYFILQIGPEGELIATGGGYYDLSDEDFLSEIMQSAFESEAQSGMLNEYNLRFCRVTTHQGESIVFADVSSERAALNALIRTSILIGSGSMVVFFFISLLLAHLAVKPVANAWDQQRQFVADASHELKTPLTVIITSAEIIKNSNYAMEDMQPFLDSILSMGHQMRGLTENLLDLARVDAGTAKNCFEKVNLSDSVNKAVMQMEPLCFEKGLFLESIVEDDIYITGSEPHLRQVTEILLDNALKYSYAHSVVRLELKRCGGNCQLIITNNGDAISAQDLKNIFKRFYRVDKVRSMNHSYGLGLAIAEGIVRDHGGKIWAESSAGLNRFHVLLPLYIAIGA